MKPLRSILWAKRIATGSEVHIRNDWVNRFLSQNRVQYPKLARQSEPMYRLRLGSILDTHTHTHNFSIETEAKKISQFRKKDILCLLLTHCSATLLSQTQHKETPHSSLWLVEACSGGQTLPHMHADIPISVHKHTNLVEHTNQKPTKAFLLAVFKTKVTHCLHGDAYQLRDIKRTISYPVVRSNTLRLLFLVHPTFNSNKKCYSCYFDLSL